ncbi:MAG: hypothetical protein ACTSU2_16350, partial [Promethearchaeota archaeon]
MENEKEGIKREEIFSGSTIENQMPDVDQVQNKPSINNHGLDTGARVSRVESQIDAETLLNIDI